MQQTPAPPVYRSIPSSRAPVTHIAPEPAPPTSPLAAELSHLRVRTPAHKADASRNPSRRRHRTIAQPLRVARAASTNVQWRSLANHSRIFSLAMATRRRDAFCVRSRCAIAALLLSFASCAQARGVQRARWMMWVSSVRVNVAIASVNVCNSRCRLWTTQGNFQLHPSRKSGHLCAVAFRLVRPSFELKCWNFGQPEKLEKGETK